MGKSYWFFVERTSVMLTAGCDVLPAALYCSYQLEQLFLTPEMSSKLT